MLKLIYNVKLDIGGIKKILIFYITYYFENPNIFKFFYFNKLKNLNKSREYIEADPNYEEMWRETFKAFTINGKLKDKDIEVVAKICIYAIHGMLTLFFTQNGDLSEENLYRDMDKMLEYLLM